MRILIVEDDTVVQGVLKAYLGHYGTEHDDKMEIQVLSDACKALALLTDEQDACDVAFLDVRLPQLRGDEIYSQLMQFRPQMVGRIIFVTAYRDDLISRFPALKLNILDKPFRYCQLQEAIAAVA